MRGMDVLFFLIIIHCFCRSSSDNASQSDNVKVLATSALNTLPPRPAKTAGYAG